MSGIVIIEYNGIVKDKMNQIHHYIPLEYTTKDLYESSLTQSGCIPNLFDLDYYTAFIEKILSVDNYQFSLNLLSHFYYKFDVFKGTIRIKVTSKIIYSFLGIISSRKYSHIISTTGTNLSGKTSACF